MEKNRRSILTLNQRKFLAEFKKEKNLASLFYLTGGTALAEFYLHHRLSDDLDFFSDKEFSQEIVYRFINKAKNVLQATEVIPQRKNGREIFELRFSQNEILKVEFAFYPYKNLKPLKKISGLLVNELFDIAVNKLFSVFTRTEIKDYVDLYYLLKRFSLNKLRKGVEEKFGFNLTQFVLGNEFFKIKNLAFVMPKMIKKLTKRQLLDFYLDKARELGVSFLA